MSKIYIELLPVFLIILTGLLLKYFKILIKEDAVIILRLVFYFCLPSLILANIPGTVLVMDFIFLPLVPIIIGSVLYFVSTYFAKLFSFERKTLGVFIISALILNTAFAIPFVIAFFGHEGLVRILILDIGNAFFIYGFAYYQACKYGNHKVNSKQLLKRILGSVPLWAIIISLLLNILGYNLTGPLFKLVKEAGDVTVPLLLLAVGVFFEFKIIKLKAMAYALFIRMGLGMLFGLLLSYLFGLDGITKYTVILATATPIGYNTLTFASIEKLDSEFAAALVSFSILIALFYVPVILIFII